MLTTHAVHRGQKRSMPIAGAAISSSRVAMAKRPTRVSRNTLTTISAPSAATHSHVFVVVAGDARQPAGAAGQLLPVLHALVDDEQHGERDHRRRQPAGAGDGDADDGAERDGDERRRRPWRRREPSSTSPRPNGRSGSVVAFVATGIATSAAP